MQTLPPKRRRGLSRSDWRDLRTGLLFISPWIVGFTFFLAYPIVTSFYYSLCDFSVLQPPQFIGPGNYRELAGDSVFRQALGNTFFYAACAIPLGIVVALALAMLLNTGVKGMAVYRTIFFLPSMVPAIALAILWLWIFNGQYGILNYTIKQIFAWVPNPDTKSALAALKPLTDTVHKPPDWLSSVDLVKPALVFMSLWGTGHAVVIYLAGLQDVPVHLYEAADLDGANWWQKTWNVTLPMVSPVILFNGIMAIIGTFNFFAIPFVMAPGGQPARSAYFLAVNLFDNAFLYLRMGYASAMAWVLFVIVFVLTMLAMKLSEKHVHYGGG
jgi:multiple sugar transport system permease protein